MLKFKKGEKFYVHLVFLLKVFLLIVFVIILAETKAFFNPS